MYPILKDCLVRGIGNDYYLQNYKTGVEYKLEEIPAQILWHCTGEYDIKWFLNNFSITYDEIIIFFNVLVGSDLLILSRQKVIAKKFPSLSESPYLREIQIDAAGKCNLFGKCKHCYGKESFQKAAKNELKTEEIQGLIYQMEELNITRCFLSGGEIFLRKDLPNIIQCISENKIHLAGIFTNGTIFRQDVMNALHNTGMLTVFLISLDSHIEKINDFMRGDGCYQKTLSFIEKIKSAGYPITINTMVIKQNVKHLIAMRSFLEKLDITRWRLSIPREQGETIINKNLIIPNWQDVFSAYEKLTQHSLKEKVKMKIAISSVFKTELVRDKTFYLFNSENNCCEYKRDAIVIKPNGDVVPCTAFDDLVFGNIRQQSLKDIWQSDLCQAFKTLPISATECRDCKINHLCGAGCRKVAWEINKNILSKDENSCPLYEFAEKIIVPLLEKNGIKSQYLKEVKPYKYDTSILKDAF